MAMSEQYELQLKSCKPVDGQKYKILELTDLSIHTKAHRPTLSIGKKVKRAFNKNEPGRVYAPVTANPVTDMQTFVQALHKDPDFIAMIQKEEADGYKVLLQFPKQGIPVKLGPDTQQFMESKNGKRALRGLAKKQSS